MADGAAEARGEASAADEPAPADGAAAQARVEQLGRAATAIAAGAAGALGLAAFAGPPAAVVGGVAALGAAAWLHRATGQARAGVAALRQQQEDPYVLEERLGAGSMGEVWRARHRMLGRAAAVKTIKAENVGREDVARFKREARATADLRSPHTVSIYDFGLGRDGEFFYAMELLDGIDLQRCVTRFGPMPEARVRALLDQACHSLAEAHGRGLVHRDVKPANVMLCRHAGDVDFVKVVDFGLVKAGAAGSVAGNLTLDHTVLGTAAYLAPESLEGSKKVDARVDVYALGCLAFYLLTGRLVFAKTSVVEMVKAHVLELPEPPSRSAPGPVSPELDALVLRCLAKKPDQRPSGAGELRHHLGHLPPAAPWTPDDARRWWDQHLPVITSGNKADLARTALSS